MGQEMGNSEMPTQNSPDRELPAISHKPVELSYTIEELLSFADLEGCKIRPENLDPVVWRDAPTTADGAEGGLSLSSRGLVRRDREGEVSGKSPADIPEWRKDSWRSGGATSLSVQSSRRKPYEEDSSTGIAFSSGHPPRPAGGWAGDNGHMRNSYDNRHWLQGPGSGRWDHRTGLQDREREQGRPFQKWDGEDSAPPILPPDAVEGMRQFGGQVGRPGWSPTERDGLLGSGGNLHRTFTGNFTTMRPGVDRQMSMGIVPERQMSMGIVPERQMSMGAHESLMKLDRQLSMGLPADRQLSLGGIPPPERQMSLGHGPPERQLSMSGMDRMGRASIPRHPEPYHLPRPSKGPAFARREDTDFNNDETFGSEDTSTDDRAEEERRRRESFESLRKDQQRLLHQKQQKQEQRLSNSESNASRKHDETSLWDESTLPLDLSSSPSSKSPPEKVVSRSEETISSCMISTAASAPVMPRPAIPPGFDKRPPQQATALVKPYGANETKAEGDNHVQGTDDKQAITALIETATTGLQEDLSGDGSGKEPITSLGPDGRGVADSHAAVSQPPLLETQQGRVPRILIGDVSTTGERTEEWRLTSEGVSAIGREEGTTNSANKAKDDIFGGLDDHRTVADHQGSLLDKWFGGAAGKSEESAASPAALPALVDESRNKTLKEASWLGDDARMSKFAQWFPSEVNNQADAVPRDILSLFPPSTTAPKISSSSSTPDAHDGVVLPALNFGTSVSKSSGRVFPMPSGPSLEDIEKGLKATTFSSVEGKNDVIKEAAPAGLMSTQRLKTVLGVDREHDAPMSGEVGEHPPFGSALSFQVDPTQQAQQPTATKKTLPVFLTCEDIEQSMLAEAGTATKVPSQGLPAVNTIARERKPVEDSAASRHLLSLLQKNGPLPVGSENRVPSSSTLESQDCASMRAAQKQDEWEQRLSSSPKESSDEEDNPTLEALFGKQFMSELRAVEAPLSATVFGEDDVVYPVNRQFSTRMKAHHSSTDTNIAKQWPRPIGPLSGVCRPESNVLPEAPKQGDGASLPGRLWSAGGQFAAAADDDGRTTSLPSSLTFWGNGASPHLSDEGGLSSKLSFGNKDGSVSNMDSASFLLGDAPRRDPISSSKGHLNGLQSTPHVNSGTNFEASGDSTARALLGSFSSSQFNLADDSNLAPTEKSPAVTESLPAISTRRSPELSQLSPILKEELLMKGLQGDDVAVKFGSTDLSKTARAGGSSPAGSTGQGSVSILLAPSQAVNGKETAVDEAPAGDAEVDLSDSRKLAETLAELVAVGKTMDGAHSTKAPLAAAGVAAVFPEHVQPGGLVRANSAFSGMPMRFKGGSGGIQSPPTGFPPFQPVGPLQHQHSLGAGGYRSDASTQIQPRLQPGVPVHPLHHHLPQQNQSPSTIPIFPTQQFHPQPGLPQPQLLGLTYSNGSASDFTHIAYGPPPSANLNRPSPASGGPSQFPQPAAATAQGHLPQPGIYHPMGPGAPPPPAHFLSSAQVPSRAAVVHPMADPRMFIQEQQVLHDPHGLGTKQPGPPTGPNLFPLRGHGLHSGQGAAIFHQPMPNSLRGPPPPPPQNQLVPGPAPWIVPPYSSDLMRTTRNFTEPTGFPNGGVMGGPESVDRWFGMDQLSRTGSGAPSPAGLIPLSAHGLNAESNMRFG